MAARGLRRVQASLASLNAGSALLARLNGSDFALLLPAARRRKP